MKPSMEYLVPHHSDSPGVDIQGGEGNWSCYCSCKSLIILH